MLHNLIDYISRLLVFVGSLLAAFLAFVETHHHAIGLMITAVGVIGGLCIQWWYRRRSLALRRIEIFGEDRD